MANAPRQWFAKWWQALLIFVGGIILGLSSCAGFLGGLNGIGRAAAGPLELLFAAGFVAGGVIALAGFIMLVVSAARALVNAFAVSEGDASAPFSSGSSSAGPIAGGAGQAVLPGRRRTGAYQILRRLQMALAILMLLPAASIATSALILISRPSAWRSVILVVATYVLSQGPYVFAFARLRRGPDRLGVTVAFAAACIFFLEGCLPLARAGHLYAPGFGPFSWPSLFLIGHIFVALFAWQAGQLSPAQDDDTRLLAGAFVGVVVYLVAVRFLEIHFLPYLVR